MSPTMSTTGKPQGAGAVAAVRGLLARRRRVVIATTKSKDFALRLLSAAGLGEALLPSHRVHGLEECRAAGGKPALIVALSQAAEGTAAAAARIVFVEDRLAPLRGLRDAARQPVTLALASWGFNVEADRVAAAAEGMVVVLQQGDLATL